MMGKWSALVAEDNRGVIEFVSEVLRLRGYEVRTASDGMMGLEMFRQEPCDLVIMDLDMPRMNGMEALYHLRARDAHVGIILMTGHWAPDESTEAGKMGAAFLNKPFSLSELDALLTRMQAERARWYERKLAAQSPAKSQPDNSAAERRRQVRAASTWDPTVMEMKGNGQQARQCEIIDLSLGGCGNHFPLDAPYPVGSEVRITFGSRAGEGLFTVPASVVWYDLPGSRCGTRFRSLTDQQLLQLEHMVAGALKAGSLV